MPPTTYQVSEATLSKLAALYCPVMTGLVDVAPALAIVTPDP